MQKAELLYKGKAKSVFATADRQKVIIHFNDDATAFNGEKHAVLADKGILNNKISTLIFDRLKSEGVPTHHLETLNDREQLCQRVDIIPLEVIVRNVVAGSMAQRLAIAEGTDLETPVFELCFKNDELGDPLINDDHAIALNLVSYEDLDRIYQLTDQINVILSELFYDIGVILVDFKIEFGWSPEGEIVLADEISPDCCRLWDVETNEKMDKDRFRRDLGNVLEGYATIHKRLSELLEAGG